MNTLLPPNLSVLGVPRRVAPPEADLETIWLTPYPVITGYRALCSATGLNFLGRGGHMSKELGKTLLVQGEQSDGYVLSGYRSEMVNNNISSPHMYGYALDIEVHDIEKQIEVGRNALLWFSRVGFYPWRKFVHVDMAPYCWAKRFSKALFWVNDETGYHYFPTIERSIRYMQSLLKGD